MRTHRLRAAPAPSRAAAPPLTQILEPGQEAPRFHLCTQEPADSGSGNLFYQRGAAVQCNVCGLVSGHPAEACNAAQLRWAAPTRFRPHMPATAPTDADRDPVIFATQFLKSPPVLFLVSRFFKCFSQVFLLQVTVAKTETET